MLVNYIIYNFPKQKDIKQRMGGIECPVTRLETEAEKQ